MAVPFAQTIRSLNADRGIAALALVALLSLLLAVWLIWAFSARFSIYANSETGPIRLDDVITTTFSVDAAKELKQGQAALIYLDSPPLSEQLILQGQVVGIDNGTENAQVRIAPDLRPLERGRLSDEILAAFSTPVPGHVAVETEMLSPATLLLRSAGINADTAPLVSRP